ncbi:predicted protein [Histoplasma capsulatum G186AR]|uniref:Uncharacterized protein n=1 Tax=Ajellomyces capsulatus (strain G186AR / H82 / ATCC MYA-2454 / RMSCC 2432) TaxID=447093 RepID=C0NRI9_AJECG|nr:uncharacterized protein HCBG_05619 [Histoplasma capsulatum G186AR]EEH06303.1 predicted protein [Histoplasma capsulatum G186AR]
MAGTGIRAESNVRRFCCVMSMCAWMDVPVASTIESVRGTRCRKHWGGRRRERENGGGGQEAERRRGGEERRGEERRKGSATGKRKSRRPRSKGNAGTGRLVGYLPVELLKGREGPHRGYRTVGAANSLGYESKKKWQYQHQYHNVLSSEGHLAPGPKYAGDQCFAGHPEANPNCGLANPAREALMLAGLVLVETILA